MKLWLDDIRDPRAHPCIDWVWVKTATEAIALLSTGQVTQASLDHDLSVNAMLGNWPNEVTGYDVVCWMGQNNVWPKDGVLVHSMNQVGRQRMLDVISRHYRSV